MFYKFTMAFSLRDLPRTQEDLERNCLEHHGERSLKLCDGKKSLKFVFVDRRSWNSECPRLVFASLN